MLCLMTCVVPVGVHKLLPQKRGGVSFIVCKR